MRGDDEQSGHLFSYLAPALRGAVVLDAILARLRRWPQETTQSPDAQLFTTDETCRFICDNVVNLDAALRDLVRLKKTRVVKEPTSLHVSVETCTVDTRRRKV
jgi:hypothetical protein